MRKILHSRRKFRTDQTGATKVEYALIATGIILAIIAAFGTLKKGSEKLPDTSAPEAAQEMQPDAR